LLALVAGAALCLGLTPAPAHASPQNDLLQINKEFDLAINTYQSRVESANNAGDLQWLTDATDSFVRGAETAQEDFARISGDADAELAPIAQALADACGDFAAAAEDVVDAASDGDSAGWDAAFVAFDSALNDYNAAVSQANKYIASHRGSIFSRPQFQLWGGLFVLAFLCLIGSLIMVAKTRHLGGLWTPRGARPTDLKSTRWLVVVGAALFLGCTAVPAVQVWNGFHNPNPDGTFEYHVLARPTILGAALFLVSVIRYAVAYSTLKKHGALTRNGQGGDNTEPESPFEVQPLEANSLQAGINPYEDGSQYRGQTPGPEPVVH
jgi:hypothetical protein